MTLLIFLIIAIFRFSVSANTKTSVKYPLPPRIVRRSATPTLAIISTLSWREPRYSYMDNTFKATALLRPEAEPIMFTDSWEFAELVGKYGWWILPVSATGCEGRPLLGKLFRTAQDFVNSPLLGYTSSNIMFTKTIIAAFKSIQQSEFMREPLLIVGPHKDVNLTVDSAIYNIEQVSSLQYVRHKSENVSNDYFFVNKLFPWELIEDYVVEPDSIVDYLVTFSNKHKITILNAAPLITALRQLPTKSERGRLAKHSFKCNEYLADQAQKLSGEFDNRKFDKNCVPRDIGMNNEGNIVVLKKDLPPQCSL